MKILLVGAVSNALQGLSAHLSERGFAVVNASSAKQAEQMLPLHSSSLDMVIVCREGANANDLSAMNFVNILKKGTEYSDIPYLLLSQAWTEAEFAKHQSTPFGANAYSKWPVGNEHILLLLEQVLGELPDESEADLSDINIGSPIAPPDPTKIGKLSKPNTPPTPPKPTADVPSLELTGNSENTRQPISKSALTLEAPGVDDPSGRDELPSIQLNVDESGEPKEATRLKTQQINLDFEHEVEKPAEPLRPPQPPKPEAMDPISLDLEEGSIPNLEQQRTGAVEQKVVEEIISKETPKLDPSVEKQLEEDVHDEMPYLFGDKTPKKSEPIHAPIGRPTGDALIPGGISQSADVSTLKKYLELREQDVGILSGQVRVYKEQIKNLEDELRSERKRSADLDFQNKSDRERLEEIERDEKRSENSLKKELNEVRFKLRSKSDKVKVLEERVREATEEVERIKERVRADIRKIRTREKELENKLELLKKDSEVLLKARENRIVDLKRKLDMSEFNIDLLQDQYQREKENSRRIQERLDKASQAMRVAGGFLDHGEEVEDSEDYDSEGSQAS